ncbi:MAG: hypothetical protein JWN70_4930 [Planctomycetaceae bacterium]|nr:hypothetical protein [Planctomycetaceae bacterium]
MEGVREELHRAQSSCRTSFHPEMLSYPICPRMLLIGTPPLDGAARQIKVDIAILSGPMTIAGLGERVCVGVDKV